ncbi:hypothetical protein [Streptomyces sp. NPDC051665]|uniref:hypothetical protein n=1 Tax=Streptomyces sp. NPDC051665 TaxID=3154647 RepID=UPI0034439903
MRTGPAPMATTERRVARARIRSDSITTVPILIAGYETPSTMIRYGSPARDVRVPGPLLGGGPGTRILSVGGVGGQTGVAVTVRGTT